MINLQAFISQYWLNDLSRYQRIYVGYSGGLDSTVLLHLLSQQTSLHHKLIAIHINHQLSVNADNWQQHCENFCQKLKIACIVQSVEFNRNANIEENARNARYHVFSTLLKTSECLVLAHHADDQAETLLLQLFRGAGIDGLAAMESIKPFAQGDMLRPLLRCKRSDLEAYAHTHALSWVEDESNQSLNYSRNFLRHQVLPLIQQKWPHVVGNLISCSENCQQAKKNLEALAYLDYPVLKEMPNKICLDKLLLLPKDRLINVLRFWLRVKCVSSLTSKQLNILLREVIHAKQDATPSLKWHQYSIRRYQNYLYLLKQNGISLKSYTWSEFPKPLLLNSLGSLIAKSTKQGLHIPSGISITIKFRQGGEVLFWHGQQKLLKNLFQEWRIPPWERAYIPLVFIDDVLVAVPGYAINDLYYKTEGHQLFDIIFNNSPE